VLLASLVSCSKPEKPVANETPAASQAGPKTFATPEDGGKALVAAVRAGDRDALLAIFGQQSKDLIFSGDAAQDKVSFERFTDAYDTMNRWRKQTDGSEVLYLGSDNNPFPIPLKKNAAGQWYFDTAAGKDEILARRIGDNELAVIGVLAAMGDAQVEYLSQSHDGAKQYAQKIVSDEGKQNGLYWKSPEGQPKSPLGPLAAYAAATEGFTPEAGKQQPFHGYFYSVLTKQGADAKGGAKDYIVNGKMTGGFAFLAYPEKYGETGIATFVINQNGIEYEKDLGKGTTEAAKAITEFNPDKSWKPVPGN
jgi:hypothetical protein